jgi:methylenetetrahydrofolate--tRNA-(uracil-5-)-methyltransferase
VSEREFDIHVIGGGLAGSEAAWQLAEAGFRVRLSEMRGGGDSTPAHETDQLAEMVCSNSFRSDDPEHNAVGLLHQEMRALNSLIMWAADLHRVPAGSALAVDRGHFAAEVTQAIQSHHGIAVVRERIDRLPDHPVIIATGPLTGSSLAEDIARQTGQGSLAFFDAIAPIVHRESIDMSIAWFQSRWDKGEGKDYINCPLDKAQYETFVEALNAGEKTQFRDWERETPYFEGCMPIEVMAERGLETLRHGPMKPVGLTDPRTGRWPYAVVQLRQDNALATLWNMVGFQTKLRHSEQVRIFRTIPGLKQAEFARLGGDSSKQLHQFAAPAGRAVKAQVKAQRPVCGPDHRVRRLCGKRGRGADCRSIRCRRNCRPGNLSTSGRDCDGRPA